MKSTTIARSGALPAWAIHGVLAVAACMACNPAPTPRERDASAAEVEVVFKRFEEAWEREDLEGAVDAFTPDAVVFDPVPPGRFEKTEGIRAWISNSFNALDQIAINTSDLRLLTMGPVAWGTGHYVFEARQEGKPVRVEGDLTMVWVLQTDGSYKLSVFHASHVPGASSG